MYADRITGSMQATIDETLRRREKQLRYNELHHITPKQIVKRLNHALSATAGDTPVADTKGTTYQPYMENEQTHASTRAATPTTSPARPLRRFLQRSISSFRSLIRQRKTKNVTEF